MMPMKGLVARQRVCHARWAPCHPQVCAAIWSSRTDPPNLAREKGIVFWECSGLGMEQNLKDGFVLGTFP